MLQLTQEQAEALEGAERAMLLRRTSAHLALQWPAVADRLGDRLPAFVDFALTAAERHGLRIALSALRYVNLCFIWGTGFEDKPSFGWARELLTDARMHEWQTVHQLVRRSVEHLAARKEGLPTPEALARADARVTQTFAGLGLLGRLLLREGVELPLLACDLELAAIRVSDADPALEYALSASGASRVTAPATAQPYTGNLIKI